MHTSLEVAAVTIVAILIGFAVGRGRPQPSASEPSPTKGESAPTSADPTPNLHFPGAVGKIPDWMQAEPDRPFDLQAFFSPIPPDANAVPLYIDALAEFDGQASVCFPPEEAATRKEQAESRTKEFAQVFAPETRRAKPGVLAEQVDRVLAMYEPGFEKIAKAQKRNRCVFDLQISFTATYPCLFPARQVASVACLRIHRAIEKGDFPLAIRTLEMLIRLARDLRPRASFLAGIVAAAIDGIGKWLTIDILASPGLTLEQADQLTRMLARKESSSHREPLADAYRAEYMILRNLLRDLQMKTGTFSAEGLSELSRMFSAKLTTRGEAIETMMAFSRKTFNLTPTLDMSAKEIDTTLAEMNEEAWRREVSRVSAHFRRLIELGQSPYPKHAEARKQLEREAEGSIMLMLLGQTPSAVPIAVIKSTADRRGALCLAFVRRWELKHGALPADLEAACKEAGLTSVPTDPFADSPMRMAMIEGQLVIYSVGPCSVPQCRRLPRIPGWRSEGTSSCRPGCHRAVPVRGTGRRDCDRREVQVAAEDRRRRHGHRLDG